MMFERMGAGGRCSIAALAVLAVMLSVFGIPACAEDGGMNVVAQASSGPLRCEIRKAETDGSVELSGVIVSSRVVAGRFRFTVTKSGPSGSSNINQAHTFELEADKESRIGLVRINREAGAQLTVELLVEPDGGTECRAKASLEP